MLRSGELLYVKHLQEVSCEQVRREAAAAFGRDEEEPSRHAAEQMIVTVSSLKVDLTCLPRLPTSCVGTCISTSSCFLVYAPAMSHQNRTICKIESDRSLIDEPIDLELFLPPDPFSFSTKGEGIWWQETSLSCSATCF